MKLQPVIVTWSASKRDVVGTMHSARVVPWCAEHDLPMANNAEPLCWKVLWWDALDEMPVENCCLEEPARHYAMNETE